MPPADASVRADSGIDAGRDAAAIVDAASAADASDEDAGEDDDGGVVVVVDPSTPGTMAPTLAKLGYFSADANGGPRILLSGRDQNGDVVSYKIKFFNGDTPVQYAVDGSDNPAVGEKVVNATQDATTAPFFFKFEPTVDFTNAVKKIVVTVTDSGGRVSGELTATLAAVPTVTGACSPQGFDRCNASSVCAPVGKNYTCTALTSARNAACSASTALVLSPPTVASVSGSLTTASLWDAPVGCTLGDPKFANDKVVKLKLAAPAAKVILSTDNAGTGFDTILYMLNKCTDVPAACTVQPCPICDDDTASNSRTTLVLNNLAAGDYFIIVDSRYAQENTSTNFTLTATIQ